MTFPSLYCHLQFCCRVNNNKIEKKSIGDFLVELEALVYNDPGSFGDFLVELEALVCNDLGSFGEFMVELEALVCNDPGYK